MSTFVSRYDRQTILPGIGTRGQACLRRASVLVVGAGGLGAPVLQYLCGAGVGHLVVMDPDRVCLENLHRQPLFREADIGRPKVEAAARFCSNLNRDVRVTPVCAALDPRRAAEWTGRVDLVLDCADSFAVSYTLSDACMEQGRPLVSASVLEQSGYCGGYCGEAPSLRAVFPDLPENIASCSTAGVTGPMAGLIGSLQAQMALQILLQLSPSPLGQLIRFDAASLRSSTFRFHGAPEPEHYWRFISVAEIRATDLVVDLRGKQEAPAPVCPQALRRDLSSLASEPLPAEDAARIVLCCASGVRAWQAARILADAGPREMVLLAAGALIGCGAQE
jgi:sulfur-carrier protein adenylyltransferase/sulfurtransferase